MKKCGLVLHAVLTLLALSVSSLMAMPNGYSNTGKDYIAGSSDLSKWSIGVYADGIDRDATIMDSIDLEMTSQQFMGSLGYDIKPWVTAYVAAGGGNLELGSASENNATYGLGAKFNILDHEIMDPTLIEDKIRINGGIQYAMSSSDWRGDTIDFSDLSASLILSIINDMDGNVLFLPNSIGIFAGGLFSELSGDITSDESFGFTAGLDIFYTERVTLEFGMTSFGDVAYIGGIYVRL